MIRYMNLKEKISRKKFKDSEKFKLLYKQLYLNSSFNIKRKISLKFSKKEKDIHCSRVVNKCLLTGRARGVISSMFKMSRYPFRMLALKGFIPGLFKSSGKNGR